MKLLLLMLHAGASLGKDDACTHSQGYAKVGAPNQTNLQDAQACQTSCGMNAACKFFMFDLETSDCWLLEKDAELHDRKKSIVGPVQCDLDQTFLSMADNLQEEGDEERQQRVLQVLHHMSTLVMTASSDQQIVDKELLAKAKKLGEATPAALKKMDYNDVMDVITAAEEVMNVMGTEFEGAETLGMVLYRADLTWLLKYTTGKDVEVPEDTEEEEEGRTQVGNSNSGSGGGGNKDRGYDARSFGAGTSWPNAEMKYCWARNLHPSARRAVECGMRQIRRAAPGIRFTRVGRSGSGCADGGALVHSPRSGCSASLGKRMFGGNNIRIGTPGCNNCGTATHEVLHALGMAHEQSRPDRDRYVQVIWQNIRSGKSNNFKTESGADVSQPYSIGSIMHYGSRSMSKNGRPTLVQKQFSQANMGQRTRMSHQDIQQLRALYGCKAPSYRVCDPPAGSLFSNPLVLGGAGAGALAVGLGAFALLGKGNSAGYSGQLQRGS